MKFSLEPDMKPLKRSITYTDRILLTGSCFTEHISERLQQHKFRVLSNPNGILFNPLSVAGSITSYLEPKQYTAGDLFYLNELWNSWDHHTRFSDTDQQKALDKINAAQQNAAAWVQKADYIIITLGSAFQYYLKENNRPVANNHRAPGQWFEKRLLDIAVIRAALENMLHELKAANAGVQVLFTISPVRHIRDGVTDNNRSKARLIEAVHSICDAYDWVHYFPAYELVIDILRDYRFYDIDFVHPNYLATSFVWEQFAACCIDPAIHLLMKELLELSTAKAHRPRFPATQAHRDFCRKYADKIRMLQVSFPFLDLAGDLAYFEAV